MGSPRADAALASPASPSLLPCRSACAVTVSAAALAGDKASHWRHSLHVPVQHRGERIVAERVENRLIRLRVGISYL